MFVMTGETIIKIKGVPEAAPLTTMRHGKNDEEMPLSTSVMSGQRNEKNVALSAVQRDEKASLLRSVISGMRNDEMSPSRSMASKLRDGEIPPSAAVKSGKRETQDQSAVDALFARVSPEHQHCSAEQSPASRYGYDRI